jgi:hypothetical protein
LNQRPLFNKVAFCFLAVFSARTIYAQSSTAATEYNIFSVSPVAAATKIGIDSWASGGTGVTEIGSSSAAFANPSALKFGSLTLSAEMAYRYKATWAFDYSYDGMGLVPAFVSIGLPAGDWNLSVSYANTYNQRLELPSIPVTTEQFPDGTGQFISYLRTVRIHTFAGSFSYALNELFSVGATFGLNVIRMEETLFITNAKATGTGLVAIVGLLARPLPSLSTGASFTVSPKTILNLDYTPTALIDPGGGNPTLPAVVAMPTFIAKSPWTVTLGASWEATSSIRIQSSLEYQHWSSVYDAYRNPLHFHAGLVYAVSPMLSARLGFFSQSDPSTSLFSQNFLTGGIRLLVDRIAVTAGVIDSHLFGNSEQNAIYGTPQFHQTIVQGGLAYTF